MKKYVNEQQGFGFFLTFLILVLGMVIGITLLMTVLNNSKAASKTLGNAQAKDLAVKGVEAAAYSLNEDISKNFNGKTGGLSHKEYIQILEREFNQRLCNARPKKPYEIKGETGTSTVCINEKPEIYQYNDIDYKSATYKVTFKSTGVSNSGEKETTYKTMLIGSEGFPEALRFSLSAYKYKNEKGSGNIFLHGISDLTGDLKAENNLIVSSKGAYSWQYWTETGYPKLNPTANNNFSRVIVNGDIYRYSPSTNNRSQYTYESHINSHYGNYGVSKIENTLSKIFQSNHSDSVIRASREATLNSIDINKEINLASHGNLSFNSNVILNESSPSNDLLKKFCKNNNNNTVCEFPEKVVIKGDLIIGNNHSNSTSKTTNITIKSNDITKKGTTFYVEGKVIIKNAHLSTNMLIYSKQDTEIRWSTISGIDLSESPDQDIQKLGNGLFIIFSKKPIYIANNSEFSNIPSTIKGFFYSEDNIEIFGAGSNIEIFGGVSGNKIVLNALNANFNGYRPTGDFSRYIHPSYPSRLKVYYDPYLVEAYLKLYPPEPVFYGPDVPIEYEIAS